jgi:hypothetical protein
MIGLNPDVGTGSEQLVEKTVFSVFMICSGSTVVVRSPLHPKLVRTLLLAAGNRK